MFGVQERPADASCNGVILGIPGCADLFFLRVFIEDVKGGTESWRTINKRRCGDSLERTWIVFMFSEGNRTWSVSVGVVT